MRHASDKELRSGSAARCPTAGGSLGYPREFARVSLSNRRHLPGMYRKVTELDGPFERRCSVLREQNCSFSVPSSLPTRSVDFL